jgi:hypothetical protein
LFRYHVNISRQNLSGNHYIRIERQRQKE